ncbi:hypothetical protein BDW74DRAFT_163216 [Aspergillus multicolor]|uniref:GNAT family N-acetyltransferase n=1 Tax=Aspergillus multicolor TaxID=41759 RepID=UPI003CCD4046
MGDSNPTPQSNSNRPPPSLPPHYTLVPGTPPVPSYLHLRLASGLSPKTPSQAAAISTGTWHGVYITHTPPNPTPPVPQSQAAAIPVAMGRIVGDGAWCFQIVDVAVLPEYQRRGLGGVIIRELLRYIMENKAEGTPYVNLLADEAGRELYRKYGFVETVEKGSAGMVWEGWRGYNAEHNRNGGSEVEASLGETR